MVTFSDVTLDNLTQYEKQRVALAIAEHDAFTKQLLERAGYVGRVNESVRALLREKLRLQHELEELKRSLEPIKAML